MGTTIAIARRLNVGYHIPQDSMTLWKGIVYIDSLEDCENITSPGIYIYIYILCISLTVDGPNVLGHQSHL